MVIIVESHKAKKVQVAIFILKVANQANSKINYNASVILVMY